MILVRSRENCNKMLVFVAIFILSSIGILIFPYRFPEKGHDMQFVGYWPNKFHKWQVECEELMHE